MTTVPVTAADRTLFAAILRPCPGCRWCQTRRVLTAVLRGLVLASRVAVAVYRASVLCVGITAATVGIERCCGRWIGMGAVVAWTAVGAALIIRDTGAGSR